MNPEQLPSATIKFLTGPLINSTFAISRPVTTIGRDRSNDIIISDQRVSRFHARLTFNNDAWEIEKLSETNTVTVNHEEKDQVILTQNTIIGLGDANSFIFSLTPIESNLSKDAPDQAANMNIQTGSLYAAKTAEKRERAPGTEVASLSELGVSTVEVTDNTTGAKKTYPLSQGDNQHWTRAQQ